MNISSSAFSEGETIPRKYTCEGLNISPPLDYLDIPEGTKSLVLLVEDPDAPAKPWVHWVVFNISPTTVTVPEGEVPQGGTEGITSGGGRGYEGPCPPSGEHSYLFKLYALDSILNLPRGADRPTVLAAMRGHELANATLRGTYERQGS